MWPGVARRWLPMRRRSSNRWAAHIRELTSIDCKQSGRTFMKRTLMAVYTAFLFFLGLSSFSAHAATKVSFPFTPISAASLPWWVAKEARYYEKYGLDVDMIYVGASPVIIQAMLGGQAGVG